MDISYEHLTLANMGLVLAYKTSRDRFPETNIDYHMQLNHKKYVNIKLLGNHKAQDHDSSTKKLTI